jgi:uncharacterized protein (DUF305 family)
MHAKGRDGQRDMYLRLAGMIAVSFVWMYAAMYAMVHVLQDVHPNVNNVYMAALMAGAMIPIELVLMRGMYPDRRSNLLSIALGSFILVGSFLAIRAQSGVGDDQFLRSMIPHHSSAILMCRQASIQDAEIKDLCAKIIVGQQAEIDQMTNILRRRSGQ